MKRYKYELLFVVSYCMSLCLFHLPVSDVAGLLKCSTRCVSEKKIRPHMLLQASVIYNLLKGWLIMISLL